MLCVLLNKLCYSLDDGFTFIQNWKTGLGGFDPPILAG